MTRAIFVAVVLATFVATTAVPGPQVVAHSHAGGDHYHVHPFLVHGDDDHDHDARHRHHDEAEAVHARRHRGHRHRPRIGRPVADPLRHVHIVSPFQPATPSPTLRIEVAIRVATGRPAAVPAFVALAPDTIRSRGPPLSARC